MPKTDLKIYATSGVNGKKMTTTVQYANNSVADATLRQFALKLNALTTNTFERADKVVTTELSATEGGNS